MEKRGRRGKRIVCSEEESVIRPPTTTKGGGGIAPNNLPPMGGKKRDFHGSREKAWVCLGALSIEKWLGSLLYLITGKKQGALYLQ